MILFQPVKYIGFKWQDQVIKNKEPGRQNQTGDREKSMFEEGKKTAMKILE